MVPEGIDPISRPTPVERIQPARERDPEDDRDHDNAERSDAPPPDSKDAEPRPGKSPNGGNELDLLI